MTSTTNIPKVFISYSHDSAEHKSWVLNFATTLRNRGIDAILDQWELKPGDDLPQFMEQSLTISDYAVMVCTKKYVAKANKGEGGVGYEKMIMTSSSLAKISDNKVIPIIREKGSPSTPTFLNTKLYVDFSNDLDLEYSLDELLRHLLDAPLYQKPPIGLAPFKPLDQAKPDPTIDGVREIMEIIADVYDKTHYDMIHLKSIMDKTNMRRLVLDRYIQSAIEAGLIETPARSAIGTLGRPYRITKEGISYLDQHGII